ncbi:MAG: hypothetical protein D6723_18110 [Acidobacteria bacterium]|nr:MAG: hypothetical protein D6723_18110 [Acidobacteriota bacterium]
MTYTYDLSMRRFSLMKSQPWEGIVVHPGGTLLVLLAITAFFTVPLAIRGLPLDNSPDTLLVSHDETLTEYQEAMEIFGDDRTMVLAMKVDDVFTPFVIKRLRALTRRVESVPGVARVVSLTNVDRTETVGDRINVARLIPARSTADELKRIADEVRQDRFIVGNLVSRDQRMATVTVFFAPKIGADREKAAVARIERIVQTEFADESIYFVGLPYMDYRNDIHVTRDLMRCAPLAILLIVVTFFIAFRSWQGVVMPLGTVSVGLIWTFGVMALMSKPLTLVTMMLPVIIMAIGSSYVIHVLNQLSLSVRELNPDALPAARRVAVVRALRFIGPAVVTSGLTTMAGFGSLAFAPIVGMRDMDLFSAVGVCATMILSLTLVPAWFLLWLPPLRRHTAAGTSYSFREKALNRVATLVVQRPGWICGIVLLGTIIALIGTTRLNVDSDLLAFYPEDSAERIGARVVRQHLGGAATFRIIVDGHRPGALQTVEALHAVVGLQRFVETLPGVDSTMSIADLVMRSNRLLGSGQSDDEAIPSSQQRLDALFVYLAEAASVDDVPMKFISDDGQRAQIIVRSNLFGSRDMDAVLRRIDGWSRAYLPSGLTAFPTGLLVLLHRTSDGVAVQQARSLAIALLLIFIMITLAFRSLRIGLVALLPNVIPIVFFFGFMGWMAIPLNVNTSLVASIVLGLAVDNAVHLIRRYLRCCQDMANRRLALTHTLRQTGGPIIFANLTLVFGFAIFAFSTFIPVRIGGLLSAMTILACFISNIIFLPVLMNSRVMEAMRKALIGEGKTEPVGPVPDV